MVSIVAADDLVMTEAAVSRHAIDLDNMEYSINHSGRDKIFGVIS